MSLLALLSAPAARDIVIDGDSIVAGGSANTPAGLSRTQLAGLLPHCTVRSAAVAGAVAENCPHASWDDVDPTGCIYYLAVGINDLAGSDTAASIYADISTAVAAVKLGGAQDVIIRTVIAGYSLTSPQETQRLALNVLIRDGAAAGGYIVDDEAADAFFATPAAALANYGPEGDGTGDGSVHPGTLGTLRLMTGLAAVIQGGLL